MFKSKTGSQWCPVVRNYTQCTGSRTEGLIWTRVSSELGVYSNKHNDVQTTRKFIMRLMSESSWDWLKMLVAAFRDTLSFVKWWAGWKQIWAETWILLWSRCYFACLVPHQVFFAARQQKHLNVCPLTVVPERNTPSQTKLKPTSVCPDGLMFSCWNPAGFGDVLWMLLERLNMKFSFDSSNVDSPQRRRKMLQRSRVCSGVLQVFEGQTPKYVNKTFSFVFCFFLQQTFLLLFYSFEGAVWLADSFNTKIHFIIK